MDVTINCLVSYFKGKIPSIGCLFCSYSCFDAVKTCFFYKDGMQASVKEEDKLGGRFA